MFLKQKTGHPLTKTHQLQGLLTVTQGAGGTQCIPPGESLHQEDPPVEITHGIHSLLHQEVLLLELFYFLFNIKLRNFMCIE